MNYAFVTELCGIAAGLGDDFVVTVFLEHPEYRASLLSHSLSPAAARRILEAQKWTADIAERLYRFLDADGLSYAVLRANEARSGPLSTILHEGALGGDVQRKLTGRKLSDELRDMLIHHGLTQEAAIRMATKNDLSPTQAVNVLEPHAETLPAETFLQLLTVLSGSYPTFLAAMMAVRPDVRRSVLDDPESPVWLLRAASAVALSPDEQHVLATRLQTKFDFTVGANLLDRPTTTAAVRVMVAKIFEQERADDSYRLPAVDDWPEVSDMTELTGRDITWALQREASPGWGCSGRAMQLVELAPALTRPSDQATVARLLADALVAETHRRCGLHWLEATAAGKMIELHGSLYGIRSMYETNRRNVAQRRSVAEQAEVTDGVIAHREPSGSRPRPLPEVPDGAGAIVLGDLTRWDQAASRNVVAYLASRLGTDLATWNLALALVHDWTDTAEALASTAIAAGA